MHVYQNKDLSKWVPLKLLILKEGWSGARHFITRMSMKARLKQKSDAVRDWF